MNYGSFVGVLAVPIGSTQHLEYRKVEHVTRYALLLLLFVFRFDFFFTVLCVCFFFVLIFFLQNLYTCYTTFSSINVAVIVSIVCLRVNPCSSCNCYTKVKDFCFWGIWREQQRHNVEGCVFVCGRGGCRLFWKQSQRSLRRRDSHLLLLYSRTPLKTMKSRLFSQPPSENTSAEVGFDATWAKDRQGKKTWIGKSYMLSHRTEEVNVTRAFVEIQLIKLN